MLPPSDGLPVSSRFLLGHSPGLAILFLTGMWEVFAIVGIRAVLIFYLIKQLHYSDAGAVEVYVQSTSACVLAGLVGGVVADRYLGVQRSVVIGAILMGVGNLMLVLPAALYPGLAILAIGNGLLRPTLLSQVGALYPPSDIRRDTAFTIYKAGCNAGAVFAPIICGIVGARYGWSLAFIASAVGMVIATIVFVLGRPFLPAAAAQEPAAHSGPTAGSRAGSSALVLVLAWIGAVFFWVAYRQLETTVPLWADRNVDRGILIAGWATKVPAASFQSVNPLLIFVLTPLVAWLWSRRGIRSGPRDDLRKMALGGLYAALCFGILAVAADDTAKASAWWLLLAIVPLTMGELYLEPVGQALFSRLAPAGRSSLLMALWFFATFAAYQVAGWAGELWTSMSPTTFFAGSALVGLICAPVMLVARRFAEE